MAATDFAALSAAQKRVWASEIWNAGRDANFWMSHGFVGGSQSDNNKPIHRVTELTETERGNVAVMQLVADLQGDGVVGDNLLEGSEEALWNDALEIRIDQLRMGIRSKGKMSEQKTVIRFRSTGKEKLSFRYADLIDEMMFLVASGKAFTFKTDGSLRSGASQLPSIAFAADISAPTANRIMYAGAATSTATLTATDTMNWNLLVKAHTLAKRKRLKPIRAGGKEYYAVVMSTEQLRDLKLDNTYQTLVSKAHNRGPNNPLFNDAVAVVDGLVIYDHNKSWCTLGATTGSKYGAGGTIDGAQALLMGAQALGLATIGNMGYEESDNTDYKNRPGMAVGRMIGMVKAKYKSIYDGETTQDFSLLSIYTAASAT